MKKFFASALCLSLGFALIGCGGTTPPAKKTETKTETKTDKDGEKKTETKVETKTEKK